MKRTGNKNLKIVAATSMAIFSLLTTFSAAFAWFTAMRKTNENADDFKVQTVSGALESITFHHLKENGKTMVTENGISRPSKYEFEKTPAGSITYDWHSDTQTYAPTVQGDTTIQLDTYTPLDQEHPLLLMINFSYEQEITDHERSISANSIVNHYLGERNNTGNPVCDLSGSPYNSGAQDANSMIIKQQTVTDPQTQQQIVKKYFPLSSAVKFQYAELAETGKTYSGQLSIDDVATANSYEFNLTSSESTSELKSGTNFVSVNDTTEQSNFTKEVSVYTSTTGKHIKHVALVVDYYAEAIEFIYSTYLGNNTLETEYEGILNFTCDWTMVI